MKANGNEMTLSDSGRYIVMSYPDRYYIGGKISDDESHITLINGMQIKLEKETPHDEG